MHTLAMLQKFLHAALPQVHTRRLDSLISAVDAVAQGTQVSITAMDRYATGRPRIRIKGTLPF